MESEISSIIVFPSVKQAVKGKVGTYTITRTFDKASFNKENLKVYNPYIIVGYAANQKNRTEVHLPKHEATAYADAENEARIQQAFARLAKNKTVLIIAHRLKTVEKADQILVMQEGRLQGVGTHNALLAACPLYAEMVAANERRERWMIRSLRREAQA